MTNRPNRGWRIRGNTARAVIKRKNDPLEITMALESQPNGKQSLTLKAEPMPVSSTDPPKMANYEFAPGKGRASGARPAFTRFALVAAWQTPRQRGWTSGLTRVPDAGKADPAPTCSRPNFRVQLHITETAEHRWRAPKGQETSGAEATQETEGQKA